MTKQLSTGSRVASAVVRKSARGKRPEFVIKLSHSGACLMLISSMWFFPFFHFGPVFWLASLFLYFLPAFLARNKPNFTSILILNIFAGWTFIGWIIALVWALSSDSQGPVAATTQTAQPAAGGQFFCTSCGQPCPAGARFCGACGAAQPATQR